MDVIVLHDGNEIKLAQRKEDNTTVIGSYSVITGEKEQVIGICNFLGLSGVDKVEGIEEVKNEEG